MKKIIAMGFQENIVVSHHEGLSLILKFYKLENVLWNDVDEFKGKTKSYWEFLGKILSFEFLKFKTYVTEIIL